MEGYIYIYVYLQTHEHTNKQRGKGKEKKEKKRSQWRPRHPPSILVRVTPVALPVGPVAFVAQLVPASCAGCAGFGTRTRCLAATKPRQLPSQKVVERSAPDPRSPAVGRGVDRQRPRCAAGAAEEVHSHSLLDSFGDARVAGGCNQLLHSIVFTDDGGQWVVTGCVFESLQ